MYLSSSWGWVLAGRVVEQIWQRSQNRSPGNYARIFHFLIIPEIFQILLLRAAGLGLKPADVILACLLFNATYARITYPAERLSDRIVRRTRLVLGYLFSMVWSIWGSPWPPPRFTSGFCLRFKDATAS